MTRHFAIDTFDFLTAPTSVDIYYLTRLYILTFSFPCTHTCCSLDNATSRIDNFHLFMLTLSSLDFQ